MCCVHITNNYTNLCWFISWLGPLSSNTLKQSLYVVYINVRVYVTDLAGAPTLLPPETDGKSDFMTASETNSFILPEGED